MKNILHTIDAQTKIVHLHFASQQLAEAFQRANRFRLSWNHTADAACTCCDSRNGIAARVIDMSDYKPLTD
jgi:hypothetical protein